MKKIIILILFFVAAISAYFGINKYSEYKNKKYEDNHTEEIEKEIEEVEEEIKEKQEELEKTKNDNKEVLEEIELWQGKIDVIKSHLS